MKNLEFSLNLNQLKRELSLKEERLEKLRIETSLTISTQAEELKAAALKIEKLESLLISTKDKLQKTVIMPVDEKPVARSEIAVETFPEDLHKDGPDWQEIINQLKLQLKLKTDIIRNMRKLQHAKPEPKPIIRNVNERGMQTDESHCEPATETKLRKELKYYKTINENQEILKEQLYSLQTKVDALQSQSLENEALKIQLVELREELVKANMRHSKATEEILKKQTEIDTLKIEAEKNKRIESTNIMEYQIRVDKLSEELQESLTKTKHLQRMGETYQFEIKLLKESLKSFDIEIDQMTNLKLDSLKEQRIRDLEIINENYAKSIQDIKASRQHNEPMLENNHYQQNFKSNESSIRMLEETFSRKIILYQKSVENLFGFKLELQPDDTFLCTSVDSSVIFKVGDGIDVIKCFDISELFEKFVTKGNSIPALIAGITLAKFENK